MNATKGYFSLVQYCPDVARREAANVGVVLFCPDLRFIQAKMVKANHRIRRFFGEEADNFQHLNAMKESLAKRLEVEKAEFNALEDLQHFVETRANKIILTQPNPVKVFDPEQDLAALFHELVDEPLKQLTVRAALPLRKRLDAVLTDQAIKPFIRTNLKVQVPTLNEILEVPYGFQNGRFSLIRPVEFTQQSESRIKNAACVHAVEGLSLFRHPDPQLGNMQLVVVADFANVAAEAANSVKSILAEGEVRMFTSDGLDDLKTEILTQGKRAGS